MLKNLTSHWNLHWKLVIVVVLFFVLRSFKLSADIINSDELRWHLRSNNFLSALKEQDFAKTYQHYQPGVTLMWIDSTMLQIFKTYPNIKHADYFPSVHAYAKVGIIFVLTLNFILQLFLLAKLKGETFAAIFGFIIATEPFLIGIDRWVHLTSLETYFSFSAFLIICYWLKDTSKYLYPIVSGAFLGLAVLSKLTSLMLLPLLLAIIIYAKKYKSIVHFIFTFFITFLLLFPALWVNHVTVLSKLVQSITNAVDGDILGTYYTGWYGVLFYIKVLAFKVSPVSLLVFILGLGTFFAKKLYKKIDVTTLGLLTFLYILVLLTLSDKKIDRYIILLMPYFVLLVSEFIDNLKVSAKYGFVVGQIGVLIYVLYIHGAVLSGYYSPLFGGTKAAVKLGVYDNSGEYLLQAANYLNNNGRPRVLVANNIESFRPVYKGAVTDNFRETYDFEVTSLDFDRRTMSTPCTNEMKFFGPRDFNVVAIGSCANSLAD